MRWRLNNSVKTTDIERLILKIKNADDEKGEELPF